MPASWLQSVNPIFIIALAPVFGWIWVALACRKREPSIPIKFFYGLFLLGVGFLVMAWGSLNARIGGPGVSPAWLVVTYFVHTLGELCLSPVGLSSVTKLAPKRLVSQMMGTWFMGAALGNLIAGLVAGKFETLPLPKLFLMVAIMAAGTGFLFLIFSRPIKRLIGGQV
jgi:POT family proton-dependent oligopeptide transporter